MNAASWDIRSVSLLEIFDIKDWSVVSYKASYTWMRSSSYTEYVIKGKKNFL